MYHITDGNAHEKIADWDTLIATLESWGEKCGDYSEIEEGDIATLQKAIEEMGWQVEEVA